MRLLRVHFDAYKSLYNCRLDFDNTCIGLVGINESGKTNVLNALAKLSPENPLTAADSPKLQRCDPYLRFTFELDEEEILLARARIADWAEGKHMPDPVLNTPIETITYHVRFERQHKQEIRYFTIDTAVLPSGYLVRRDAALMSAYTVKLNGKAVPLEACMVMSTADLAANEDLKKEAAELRSVRLEIQNLRTELDTLQAELPDASLTEDETDEAGSEVTEPDADGEVEEASDDASYDTFVRGIEEIESVISKKLDDLRKLENRANVLAKYVADVDIEGSLASVEEELASYEDSVLRLEKETEKVAANIREVEISEGKSDTQAKEMATLKKSLAAASSKLRAEKHAVNVLKLRAECLREPLEEKFTDDPTELARHLGQAVYISLCERIPRVVSWRYSKHFLLSDETLFDEMLRANGPDQISRPLFNLFRIGLNVRTIDELHSIIYEIQTDASERSRHQERMNDRVAVYLKSVWPDYNQQIKVFLEQERVRVQFVDPSHSGASFYTMQERSQGCQTFISFLFTIGAEAKHGVINNTLLLLDEPETHLHPSGVKHMRRELITASQNGNLVVYATHSVFMIDRENFDRHIMVEKVRERTVLKPSKKDRVGYFMQEVVLYSALDVDTADEFSLRKKYNFVLEGDGDVALLTCYYTKALRTDSRPSWLKSYSQKSWMGGVEKGGVLGFELGFFTTINPRSTPPCVKLPQPARAFHPRTMC